ncbi:hypothetical protein COLO4_08798 [Corchorus olitorius]|uniref:Uncharacterized protein n=1 Tax=Corchorus olitorius TaxID=93759 RepID=A0A1R3KEQ4_9ROSI|nr:hypothetical protein COLO4_08798 [Corchorus olitorius]
MAFLIRSTSAMPMLLTILATPYLDYVESSILTIDSYRDPQIHMANPNSIEQRS